MNNNFCHYMHLDETLSSCLYRSLQKHDCREEVISNTLLAFDSNPMGTFDPDYAPTRAVLVMASTALKCDIDALKPLMRKSCWTLLIERQERRFYCPVCIFADVATAKHPVWRRTWDGFEAITCPEHCIPLSSIEDRHLYSDKARVAYSSACVESKVFGGKFEAPLYLSHSTLGGSAAALASLWGFGRHVQSTINICRRRGVTITGIFKGLPWQDCQGMFRLLLALSLRGHSRHHEQRCFVSRVLRGYTIYNPALTTLDAREKMAVGFSCSNIIARLIALIILGVYCKFYTSSQLLMLKRMTQALRYEIPLSVASIKKELLASEISDYHTLIAEQQMLWPEKLRVYWDCPDFFNENNI